MYVSKYISVFTSGHIQGGVAAQDTIIGIPDALISCLTKIFNHRPNMHVILASIPQLFLDDMSSSSDLTKVRMASDLQALVFFFFLCPALLFCM